METSKLTLLLPSTPYVLAYTLPLLLLSALLIFSGSFLTLDRTRSFPPNDSGADYSALPGTFDLKTKKRKFNWLLEGGVGGLAIGYTSGVNISTLLALLIPATTSSASLSPKSFLAVWILCCIPTTVLCGRYRLASLLLAGISGGITTSLAFSIILHPSLLPRQVLLAVFSILLTLLLLLAAVVPRLSMYLLRPTLRFATSSLGSFGMVVSIALLSNPRVFGWANAWERLWLHNGDPKEWGTGKEKGLSAAWVVFWLVGMASDWALSRWIGECPDEKWDHYLSKYAGELPNQADRAGTFQPLQSFWAKWFSTPLASKDHDFFGPPPSKDKDIIFPSDKEMQRPLSKKDKDALAFDDYYALPPPVSSSPLKLNMASSMSKKIEDSDEIPPTPGFLKKSRSQRKSLRKGGKLRDKKKPIRFGTIYELSSDSSDDEMDGVKKPLDVSTVPVADSNMQNGRNGSKDSKDGEQIGVYPPRPWIVTNQQPSFASDTSASTLVDDVRQQRTLGSRELPSASGREEPHEIDHDIDYEKELQRLQAKLGATVEVNGVYSDSEDEGSRTPRQSRGSNKTCSPLTSKPANPGEAWTPAFLQRHRESHNERDAFSNGPMGALPIPATPSLIKAVDRIVAAQREVYGASSKPTDLSHDGLPLSSDVGDNLHLEDGLQRSGSERRREGDVGEEMRQPQQRSPRWEEFWREVRVKAQAHS